MQASFKADSVLAPEEAVSRVRAGETSFTLYKYILWSIIGLGLFFRIYHYLDNRSLWVDEIYLMTSLIKMNFIELATSTLDYQQKAPIGFLWLVKLSSLLFGVGEMALRLVPFLSGLAAFLLFLPVARQFLTPMGVLLAMSIFALAPPLVYHTVEIKQYSTDLFATVLSLYLYIRYHQRLDYKNLFLWGAFGAVLLWFSFSVIFVLAGIAIGLSLHYLINKKWNTFFRSMIPFSMWLVSFALNFFLFTYRHTEAEWLVSWFRTRGGFAPVGASIMGTLAWIVQSLYRMLEYPLGVLWNAEWIDPMDSLWRVVPKMGPVLFLFACLGVYYYFKRRQKLFLVLVFPIILTVVASLLQKYPFYERLLVFLAPLPILFLAHSCAKLTTAVLPRAKWSLAFPAVLLAWPLFNSVAQVVDTDLFGDYKKSYYRDALLYIDQHLQEGDVVYIYWNAKPAYRFYKATYGLKMEARELTDARFLVKDSTEYLQRLRPEYQNTEGVKRIWFVYEPFLMLEIGDYDHKPEWYHNEDVRAGKQLRKDLATMGEEEGRFIRTNIGVYLYDLSQNEIGPVLGKAGH